MNVIKTSICNEIEDEFLMDILILFIKRNIFITLNMESIINDFQDLKFKNLNKKKTSSFFFINNYMFLYISDVLICSIVLACATLLTMLLYKNKINNK